MVEKKQEMIGQIFTSKSPARSCEDIDSSALDYAEIKALCAGDPRIKERMQLDVEVSRLKLLQSEYRSQQYRMEDMVNLHLPAKLRMAQDNLRSAEKDAGTLSEHPVPKEGFVGIEIDGKAYEERKAAGKALKEFLKSHPLGQTEAVGTFRGFRMKLQWGSLFDIPNPQIILSGSGTFEYRVDLGDDTVGNITRIESGLKQVEKRLADCTNEIASLHQQEKNAREQLGKPFPYEEELKAKTARLTQLNSELNIDRVQPAAPDKAPAEKRQERGR